MLNLKYKKDIIRLSTHLLNIIHKYNSYISDYNIIKNKYEYMNNFELHNLYSLYKICNTLNIFITQDISHNEIKITDTTVNMYLQWLKIYIIQDYETDIIFDLINVK